VTDPGLVVLLVEDEAQMRRFLRATLSSHGYRVVEAATGEDALAQARTRNPDVVLLDLGLPDIDGLEVIKEVRTWSATPILILSARGQEQDKIDALDAGADDYLTKPFGAGELLARIRVALRHAARPAQDAAEEVFAVSGLRVDVLRREVHVEEREVHLTPIEFKLLTAMIRSAGKVMTHRNLITEVWGPAHAEQTHYLRVYMAQLRQKIELAPARPRFIVTEPGVGYRFRVD
jgi:two-component system, OmpR family, KDP operon response regulator KdpE